MTYENPNISRLSSLVPRPKRRSPISRYAAAVVAGSLFMAALVAITPPEEPPILLFDATTPTTYVAEAAFAPSADFGRDFDLPRVGLSAPTGTDEARETIVGADATAGWPAPSVPDSQRESGNVVDLTY